jgi:ubiquinone/menaquinone biosynthesis C-methylase UbiE
VKNRPVGASNFLYRIAHSDLFAFNLRSRDRWVAEQAGQITRGKRVIDVGAGSAPYRALFSHCEYKTQDFAALRPDQLRGGGYAQIDYVCDAKTIPVADASFDVVLCTEVLEHHPEPAAVICEFARILSMGGILLLTAPLGSGIHQEPNHYYGGYTPYWYRRFLPEAGFSEISIEPNAGSFRHYAQESIRFMRMTAPFRSKLPFPVSLVWFPFWLFLAPLLMGLIPLAAKLLDRFDDEKHFTVGYHVRAVRRDERVES